MESPTKPASRCSRQKALWYTAFFLCLAGFICHISVQLATFLDFNVIRTAQPTTRQASFPELLVCLPTFFSGVRSQLHRLHSLSYRDDVFDNLVRVWRSVDHNASLPARIANAKLTFLPLLSGLAVGSTPGDVVTSCRYDSRPCDVRNFTGFYSAAHGLCLSFSPLPPTLAAFQEGVARGLALNLMMEKSTAPLDLSRSSTDLVLGYKLSLQPPGDWPAIGVPQGIGQSGYQLLFSFEHRQVVFKSRPRHPCVAAPFRSLCRLEFGVAGLRCRPYRVSKAVDELVRRQEALERRCGCVTLEWPVPEEMRAAPSCHALPEAAFLVAKVDEAAQTATDFSGRSRSLTALLGKAKARFACYSDAKRRPVGENPAWVKICTENSYSTVADYFTNPFRAGGIEVAVKTANKLFDFEISRQLAIVNASGMTSILRAPELGYRGVEIKQNGFQLNLFAANAEMQGSREILQYEVAQFFADIGALLGVWVGLSALSLIAIVNQIIRHFCRCCGGEKRKGAEK